MASGYIRQASANIQPNLNANAEDLNAEYNQLQSAFDNTTGHDHSGSASGVGAQISLTASVTGVLPTANGGTGNANGKQQTPVRNVTGSGAQSVTSADGIITWTPASPANVNFTLPGSPASGDTYEFKYNLNYGDVYSMTITPPGGHTIEGNPTLIIFAAKSLIQITYVGSSNWIIR
jgi:hypothetical protein